MFSVIYAVTATLASWAIGAHFGVAAGIIAWMFYMIIFRLYNEYV